MSVSVFMSVCLYVLIAGVAAAAVLSMVMFTMWKAPVPSRDELFKTRVKETKIKKEW